MKVYQVIADNQDGYEDYHECVVATFLQKQQAEEYVRLASVGEHEVLECDHYTIKEQDVDESVDIKKIAAQHFLGIDSKLSSILETSEYILEGHTGTYPDECLELHKEVKNILAEVTRLSKVFGEEGKNEN